MTLERWETKITTSANCDVTPQAIWPTLNSSKQTDEPKVAYFRPIQLTRSRNADKTWSHRTIGVATTSCSAVQHLLTIVKRLSQKKSAPRNYEKPVGLTTFRIITLAQRLKYLNCK